MNELRNIPLSHLRIFEVAGRRGAFTFAAKELGLTASAVSHSIRKLEELLTVTLFKRSTREITLTKDGLILLEHIQRGFAEIKHGLDVITSNKNQQLRVHSTPSFANQWLLPRLTEFVNQFPDIEISISSSNEVVEFEQDKFDADIVYNEPAKSLYKKIPLSVEVLTPLCAPEVAAKIKRPEDLYKQALIQCDLQIYQWAGWFEANNMIPPIRFPLHFDRSYMAINAAIKGLGVVLESTLLAEQEIKNGLLVSPLIDITNEIHYIGHYLVYPERHHHNAALETFREWLLTQLSMGSFR